MKRTHNNSKSNVKKQKPMEEGLWDDDMDEDEIAQCNRKIEELRLTENYINLHSTQNIPSKFEDYELSHSVTVNKIDEEYKTLKEKYETTIKDISILRSQLRQVQKVINNGKMQELRQIETSQQNWAEKYEELIKEKKKTESDLQKKVLVRMKLKEIITEFKSHRSDHNGTLNLSRLSGKQLLTSSQHSTATKTAIVQTDNTSENKIVTDYVSYPLLKLIPDTFFKKCINKNDNTIQLQNSMRYIETIFEEDKEHKYDFIFKSPEIKKEVLSTECFSTELISLMKSTKTELNSPKVVPYINKITLISRELLLSVLEHLKEVGANQSDMDLRYLNARYLHSERKCNNDKDFCIFSGVPWNDSELAIELRRSLAILSTLARHNSYLAGCLTEKCCLQLNESQYSIYTNSIRNNPLSTNMDEDIFQLKLTTSQQCIEVKCDILNILLQTTRIIGQLRRTNEFCGFLSSVLSLLTSLLHDTKLSEDCCNLIYNIYKQVLFTPATTPVLQYLSKTLKLISSHSNILPLLCKKSNLDTIRKGELCLMFTEEACSFQIAANLLDRHKTKVQFSGDLINFFQNSLSLDTLWMYEQEHTCECLFQALKTLIGLLYGSMREYLDDKKNFSKEKICLYKNIFRRGLILNSVFLHRASDLYVGDVFIMSQFLSWLNNIQDIKNDLELDDVHNLALETLTDLMAFDIEEVHELDKSNEEHLKNQFQLLNIND